MYSSITSSLCKSTPLNTKSNKLKLVRGCTFPCALWRATERRQVYHKQRRSGKSKILLTFCNKIININGTQIKHVIFRIMVAMQGSRNFELKIGLDSRVTKYPPQLKKQKKNVVAKTNDIVIYASRCITTFPELSKVFFHLIFEENPK